MNQTRDGGVAGPAIVCGFAMAVVLWVAWYLTHLPWLGLSERARMPILLAAWVASAVASGTIVGRRSLQITSLAGFISALPGLMLLGTKLAATPEQGDVSTGLVPQAGLMAAGFVALGLVVGAVGGLVGGRIAAGRAASVDADWLGRFAVVTAASVAPLLFIGGLVTSTDAGMAVPDWPNTYGSNMFLYPLGSHVRADVFFEHSHRLFATLVGLSTVVLAGWTLVSDARRWVKTLALVTLATVVLQGVLGGTRVIGNSALAGMVHGVLAQITFGLVVTVAVALAPTWKRSMPEPSDDAPTGLRRLRFFSTGTMHALILQLIFGAMYRHFRDNHSLMSHIGFSVVVVIFAAAAGFLAGAVRGHHGGIGPLVRWYGKAVLVIVALQFVLGWASFLAGGKEPLQALIRTLHQANGGLLIAATTALFFWVRRLLALRRALPA